MWWPIFQDEYWQSLIQYCIDHGGYTGCSIPGYEGLEEEEEDPNEEGTTSSNISGLGEPGWFWSELEDIHIVISHYILFTGSWKQKKCLPKRVIARKRLYCVKLKMSCEERIQENIFRISIIQEEIKNRMTMF